MSRVIFRPNRRFAEQQQREAAFRAMTFKKAKIAAAAARAIAPKGPTGRYSSSIGVKVDGDGRPVIYTDDFAGHIVEWGSVNNPPYAVLRRAVRAVGFGFRESSR